MNLQTCRRHPGTRFLRTCPGCTQELYDIEQANRQAAATRAELIEAAKETDRLTAYAANALRNGQFLATNVEDNRQTSVCGLDPRQDRDWYLGLHERHDHYR